MENHFKDDNIMTFSSPTRRKRELYSNEEEEESDNETVVDAFTQTKLRVEREFSRSLQESGSRFNPHPDEQEVQEVRTGYANLLDHLHRHKKDLPMITEDEEEEMVESSDSPTLLDLVQRADRLHTIVRTTVDATYDSRFMAESSEIAADRIGRLSSAFGKFGPSDLIAALLERFGGKGESGGGSHLDFGAIGALAGPHWLGIATTDHMIGPLDLVPRQRAPRTQPNRTRRSVESGPPVLPQTLKEGEEGGNTNASETSANVMRVYQCLVELLEDAPPPPLMKFILDPGSFSRTVENLFYTSFLVSAGRVRIFKEESVLLIDLIAEEDEDGEDDQSQRRQAIYSLTIKDWRDLCQQYALKEPLIKL